MDQSIFHLDKASNQNSVFNLIQVQGMPFSSAWGIPPLCRFSDSIIDNLHFPFKCAGIYIVTFHSAVLAEHPFPPTKAAKGDSSQSPGKAAASGGWSAQSPPPACCWDRIHPQCAPTPPKSAAVRLHQTEKALETYSRAFLLLYQLYSHVLRTILWENITADFNIFPRAVRF